MEDTKQILNKQQPHWETKFTNKIDMFGGTPSESAVKAVEVFKKQGITKILELGGGQGRDTIYFAQNGLQVYVLDYTESGVAAIKQKAEELGLADNITAMQHDVRNPLPFDDEFFAGCYSHMLYCMALTTKELEFLSQEIRRVLQRDGMNIYTARNTKDVDFGTGIHRGENIYEIGGFVIHFFSEEMVERLAKGYENLEISEFEEGGLPRRLYFVVGQKV